MVLKKTHDNRLEDVDLTQDLSTQDYDVIHTDIPRARAGKLGAQFWAAYVDCESQYNDAVTHFLDQIDVIKRMCDKYPDDFEFVTTADGIMSAFNSGKIASLIGVEGGHSIDSFPSVLRMLRELGALYMTLTHNCNTPWADTWKVDDPKLDFNATSGGISDWGKKVIKEMNRIGMFIDLSHVSIATMKDALVETKAPVIFSHSSAFSRCNSYRNVKDEIFPLVSEWRGDYGQLFTYYINCPPQNISNSNLTYAELRQVVDHFQYIKDNCGIECVGIGADYDGVPNVPEGLEDVSKYPNLIVALIKNGWTETEIKAVLGNNLLRAMRQMEKVSADMKAKGELPLEENMPREEELSTCRTYGYEPPA